MSTQKELARFWRERFERSIEDAEAFREVFLRKMATAPTADELDLMVEAGVCTVGLATREELEEAIGDQTARIEWYRELIRTIADKWGIERGDYA